MGRQKDAPHEIVFQAWTDSKHLPNWWGPKGSRLRFRSSN
ncbi:SRPBCC domain-containing protein [Paenibacillus sp. PL91]